MDTKDFLPYLAIGYAYGNYVGRYVGRYGKRTFREWLDMYIANEEQDLDSLKAYRDFCNGTLEAHRLSDAANGLRIATAWEKEQTT